MGAWRYAWLLDELGQRLTGVPYTVYEVATGRRRLTACTTRAGRYRLPADRTRAYRLYLILEGRTLILDYPQEA